MSDDDGPEHVIDHVFLGSKAHAKDLETLKKLNITHILNVTPTKKIDPVAGVPNFFEKDKIFEYRRCALYDNKAEDISGALEGCVAFMDHAKFYGRVLVHCNKGVSRSTSMVIAYLIKRHEMSYADALALVQSKRSIAQPNPSFERQLIAYDERMTRLRKRKAVKEAEKPTTSNEIQSSSRTEAIGPQLPPHLMKRKADEVSDHERQGDKTTSDSIHDAGGPPVDTSNDADPSTIGPSLPTAPLTKRKLDTSDSEQQHTKRRVQPTIGPAQPPVLQ